jgi:hypothetical protein
MSNEGHITGLPTLMAVYGARLDAESVMERLRSASYPLTDVSVYHRPKGTDQVIDATTGQVASGQALTDADITPKMLETLETVVLLHPPDDKLQAVQDALSALGPVDFLHESATLGMRRDDRRQTTDDR